MSTEYFLKKSVSSVTILWLLCSGIYLTKLTPFSPVYFAFILICLKLVLGFIQNANFQATKYSLLCGLFILFSFFLFLNSSPGLVINIIITIMSPIIVSYYCRNRYIKAHTLLNIFLLYGVIFVIDGLWRLSHPYLDNVEKLDSLGIGFQIYKVNSLMYLDSNFVGLEAVFILSVIVYLMKELRLSGYYFLKYLTVISCLILGVLLTFSRAAIIAMIIMFVVNLLLSNRRLVLLSFFLVPAFLFIVIEVVLSKFENDISFASKFHIISYTLDYISTASLTNIFFGVGIGNSIDAIGMGAHNLIVTFFIESGFFGLTLFLILLSVNCYYLKSDAFIVVMPFMIAAMSLGTTALPYFFTFSFLCSLYKTKQFDIILNSHSSR
ncbi:O-antigen ligase family protein [Enterobacter hormaechei subsp. xiangfangensis]|nr:O-antigen ligase family protein [Enterobacter hormaechei]